MHLRSRNSLRRPHRLEDDYDVSRVSPMTKFDTEHAFARPTSAPFSVRPPPAAFPTLECPVPAQVHRAEQEVRASPPCIVHDPMSGVVSGRESAGLYLHSTVSHPSPAGLEEDPEKNDRGASWRQWWTTNISTHSSTSRQVTSRVPRHSPSSSTTMVYTHHKTRSISWSDLSPAVQVSLFEYALSEQPSLRSSDLGKLLELDKAEAEDAFQLYIQKRRREDEEELESQRFLAEHLAGDGYPCDELLVKHHKAVFDGTVPNFYIATVSEVERAKAFLGQRGLSTEYASGWCHITSAASAAPPASSSRHDALRRERKISEQTYRSQRTDEKRKRTTQPDQLYSRSTDGACEYRELCDQTFQAGNKRRPGTRQQNADLEHANLATVGVYHLASLIPDSANRV